MKRSPKLAFWALGLVLLGGCSYPEPPRGAVDLVVDGNVVRAWIDVGQGNGEIYESADRGVSWEVVLAWDDQIPPDDLQPETSTTACIEERPCFRTALGSDTAVWAVNADGTEAPAWSFPPGRLEFVERYPLYDMPGAYDPRPRDIVAVGDVVLVAMGNDGVLRRAPNGGWTRGVLGQPQPLAKWGANIAWEATAILTAVSFVMAVLLLFDSRSRTRRDQRSRIGPWETLGYMMTVPAILLVVTMVGLGTALWPLALALVPTLVAATSTWLKTFPRADDRAGGWPWALLLGVPGGGALALTSFLLWSGGVIAHHDVASWLARIFGFAGFILSWVAIGRTRPARSEDHSLPELAVRSESETSVSVPWRGALIVASGALFAALVFLLPYHLLENPADTVGQRLLLAAGGFCIALAIAAHRGREGEEGRYVFPGLGASLLGGPGVGAMFVLRPSPPASTTLRCVVYVGYWIVGLIATIAATNTGLIQGLALLIFGAFFTLSPLSVPLADAWALRSRKKEASPAHRV